MENGRITEDWLKSIGFEPERMSKRMLGWPYPDRRRASRILYKDTGHEILSVSWDHHCQPGLPLHVPLGSDEGIKSSSWNAGCAAIFDNIKTKCDVLELLRLMGVSETDNRKANA